MKNIKILLVLIFCLTLVTSVLAEVTKVAKKEDIEFLKQDLVLQRLKVGETRLMKVLDVFGQPDQKEDSEKKVVLKYGDLDLEFSKQAFFRKWEYDYSHKTAYRDSIDDLRKDLEDGQIIGEYYTKKTLFKDYDEPTEAQEKFEDGQFSFYYYGELKLTFENVFLMTKWKGNNIGDSVTDKVLESGQKASSHGVYQSNSKRALEGVWQSKPKEDEASSE